MRMWPRLAHAAAAFCLTASLASAAHAEPLRIFYFTWVGFAPLFVAQEKGLFENEGVEVELIQTEVHSAAFAGLFAGQVDAITGAVQDTPVYFEPDEEPLVCGLTSGPNRGCSTSSCRRRT